MNEPKYDFVIVGAGFAGASCARLLTDKGYNCLIIEERPFVGGNCLTDKQNNIDIHFLGPHILRTNDTYVWEFIKLFGEIHEHKYRFVAWNEGKIYPIPYGMDLLNVIYNKTWPYECQQELNKDIIEHKDVSNIKNYVLNNFGESVYTLTIKNFYEKQYGEFCDNIPIECLIEENIKPLRYLNSYYQEIYQGVPENGYVNLIETMLGDDIDVLLNVDFLSNKEKYMALGKYVIYTGELDKFFNYCMGSMNWKGVKFEFRDESDKASNLSGVPVVNFTDDNIEWYRMTEHKWLTPWRIGDADFDSHTFVTYELHKEWKPGDEAYYPFPDERSLNLSSRYIKRLKTQYPKVFLCGGKPFYKFRTICETVRDAMNLVDQFEDKQ